MHTITVGLADFVAAVFIKKLLSLWESQGLRGHLVRGLQEAKQAK